MRKPEPVQRWGSQDQGTGGRRRFTVRSVGKRLLLLLLVAAVLTGAGVGAYILFFPLPAPQLPETTEIYDAEGQLVTRLFAEHRIPVELTELPSHVSMAVLAVEDERFYQHPGVDIVAVARAVVANVGEGRVVQGGSTITQQLAKNVYLSPRRTLRRKVIEAVLALKLEYMYEKRELLEMYLNAIYLGHGTYGVEAASRYYFDKPAEKLTLAESALLAGLIRSPETHSPRRHPEAALRWRNVVLNQLEELGWVAPEKIEAARSEKLQLAEPPKDHVKAPYFVDYVVRVLEDRHPDWQGDLHKMGLRIHTTLDTGLQRIANNAVSEALAPLQEQDENGVPQPQSAVVMVDSKEGSVRALVGGSDFEATQLNRAVHRPGRQPGSAFKPIVYAALLDNGFTPLSTQPCEPVTYQVGSETYTPTNFGDEPYRHRRLTMRESLALSDNVTTVRWTDQLGPGAVIQYARRLGIDSQLKATLSIGLGAYEATPLDMAAVYAVFANGGWRVEPRVIERVETANGRVLDNGQLSQRKPVLSAEVSWLITDMLGDVLEWGTAKHIGAKFSRPAAAKTGTSQKRRDAWFVGYTPGLVTAVWVGNDTPRPLPGVGGTLAGPIWLQVMKQGLADEPVQGFERPPGLVKVKVCKSSGLLPKTHPETYEEWFVKGTEPAEPCPVEPEKNWWQRVMDYLRDRLKNRGQ